MALSSLPLSLTSLVFLASSSILKAAASSTVDDSRCNCYISNGTDVAYFTNHKFFDFRSLSQYQGVPKLLQGASETTSAPATADYFNDDSFTSFWESQTWNNSATLGGKDSTAMVLMLNTRNNVYIEQNRESNASPKTWLTLRTARQAMFQSSAEMVTQNDNFQFLSMRMLARTVGHPGACTAMFTYRPAPANQADIKLQEADLEMLTKYPRDQVQCTNQPSVDTQGDLIEPATLNVSMPNQATWDKWALYRMDWTPQQTTWYVNGVQIANISFQTPRDASRVHLNAWSDGGNWNNRNSNDWSYWGYWVYWS